MIIVGSAQYRRRRGNGRGRSIAEPSVAMVLKCKQQGHQPDVPKLDDAGKCRVQLGDVAVVLAEGSVAKYLCFCTHAEHTQDDYAPLTSGEHDERYTGCARRGVNLPMPMLPPT